MLRRSSPLVLASLAILVLASVPRVAAADQYDRSAWEFTLAGTGASDKDLENNTVGADIGLGVFLGPFELGVRQSINYASVSSPAGDDDSFSGSTRAFADFELEIGSFAPFIGANIGYVYGDFVKDQFIAGPEAAEDADFEHAQLVRIRIELDGTEGYGSSFLEEAFGGLVRLRGFGAEELHRLVTLISDEDESIPIEIWDYIDSGKPGMGPRKRR